MGGDQAGPSGPMSRYRSESRSRRIDEACRRFEDAWKAGQPPRIEDYLPDEVADNKALLRELLVQLVAIDLEFHWRSVAEAAIEDTLNTAIPSANPRLADYVLRFPALGPVEELPVELITHEYYVRQRWGDRPLHDEYLAAFGQGHAGLQEALEEVDRELREDGPGVTDQKPSDPEEERQLIAAAVAGRREALEQLLLRYYDSLHREVERMLGDAGIHTGRVQEALQLVHTRAFQSIGTLQAKADYAFRAWLSALAADLVEAMQKTHKKPDQDASGDMDRTETW